MFMPHGHVYVCQIMLPDHFYIGLHVTILKTCAAKVDRFFNCSHFCSNRISDES